MMLPTAETARQHAKQIEAYASTTGADSRDTLDTIEYLDLLRKELDDRIAGQIAVARAQGAEWQHVGNALRVTKQAAHQRYGRP